MKYTSMKAITYLTYLYFLACEWLTPTDRNNVFECIDGKFCEGYSCCNDHGGRKRCPKNLPVMSRFRLRAAIWRIGFLLHSRMVKGTPWSCIFNSRRRRRNIIDFYLRDIGSRVAGMSSLFIKSERIFELETEGLILPAVGVWLPHACRQGVKRGFALIFCCFNVVSRILAPRESQF